MLLGGAKLPPGLDFGYASIVFFQNGHGLFFSDYED